MTENNEVNSVENTAPETSSGTHAQFHAYVVTPFEVFFDSVCTMLVIPAADGELGVMKDHMPVVTALYPGELRIQKDGKWLYAFVSNGYVQIERDYTMVVCNSAEWAENIDPGRAKEAMDRAQERYDKAEMAEPERKRAAHAIRRAKNRLAIATRAEQRGK